MKKKTEYKFSHIEAKVVDSVHARAKCDKENENNKIAKHKVHSIEVVHTRWSQSAPVATTINQITDLSESLPNSHAMLHINTQKYSINSS